MNKMLLTILLLALVVYGQQKVAIINTVDDEEPPIKISELNHLTDRLREIANKTLPQKSYAVMTQQSIQSLYPSNEDMIRACSGAEGCLVKIGREIAADYICQGRIGRFGKNYTIKVELYESMSGNLVSSFTGNAKDIYGLLAILNTKAPEAFKKIIPKSAQEVCKDDGNTWVNGECKTAAELADECEFAGKVWEKNACRAKTKREVCEGDGKVWENGVCKAPASGGVLGNVLTDARDGKKYKTVKIGSQIWMAENLNYAVSGSKCYDNNTRNCAKYGRLYYYNMSKNICPYGWHLPNSEEWEVLMAAVDGKETAGSKLKAKRGWNDNGNGTDSYGFSALPSGMFAKQYYDGDSINLDGGFINVGYSGYWLTSVEYVSVKIYVKKEVIIAYGATRFDMLSVRCVMD